MLRFLLLFPLFSFAQPRKATAVDYSLPVALKGNTLSIGKADYRVDSLDAMEFTHTLSCLYFVSYEGKKFRCLYRYNVEKREWEMQFLMGSNTVVYRLRED